MPDLSEHFTDLIQQAFQDLKQELELQGKSVSFNISDDRASITILDAEEDRMELEYSILVRDGALHEEYSYLDEDGDLVRKKAQLQADGQPARPEKITQDGVINNILDTYRSSNPYAKIVMYPYNVFYE